MLSNKKQYQKYSQKLLDEELIKAAFLGDVDVVDYLLTSDELSIHADIHTRNDDYDAVFQVACEHGNMPLVRYLLTSPKLTHSIVLGQNKTAIIRACQYGHINVLQYLLTSSELTSHLDIKTIDSKALLYACQNQHFDLFKYLLSSPELQEHASILKVQESILQILIEKDNVDALRYVVCELPASERLSIETFTLEDYHFACEYHKFNALALLLPLSDIDIQHSNYPFEWFITHALDNVPVLHGVLTLIQKNNYIDYLECLTLLEGVLSKKDRLHEYNELLVLLGKNNQPISSEVSLML